MQMADRGSDVERLLAIEEIRDLALRYAHALLALDSDLWLSLWERSPAPAPAPALDVHWARAAEERFADIRSAVSASGRGATMLHVTNHMVRLTDPTSAQGRVQCLALLDRGHRFIEQSILYEDDYVVQDGRWAFRRRRHLLWFGQGRDPHPVDQPRADWPNSQSGADNLLGMMTRFPAIVA